ncbi:MAG: hypothetical protein KF812_09825 [Fimbriimonadaceae bacterium]|nr:hypothetical protein [Fimbriimonadaceae bacterium]
MKWPKHLDPRLVGAVLLGGLVGCAAVGSGKGAIGFLAGSVSSLVSLVGLAGVIQIMTEDDMTMPAKAIRVSLFIGQFGLFAALALWVHGVGTPTPECFLMGVGLVYIGLVVWAQAKQAETD